jgi:hypothetical protein
MSKSLPLITLGGGGGGVGACEPTIVSVVGR